MTVDPSLLQTVEWRCIGPPRGGRVVAVAGDPVDAPVFYFGACAGGVWKTNDGGTYWENVSDGYFNTAAVGAIAVSDSDTNVVYAGTGESCIRGNVSHGDGVYRSTDKGKSWSNVGLSDTRHIARIRIHPSDPDTVYVAALGHAYGPNEERGVFRSQDGGQTWQKVLFRSEKTGAIDLSMDPTNPRRLFASLWQVQRTPHSLISGGPESGIFRSTDGGDTWTDISGNPGLPSGPMGRIGIAVSPSRPERIYATIEAKEFGLYRSDDGGDTWGLITDNRDIQGRPWYYQHIFADPQDANTVWVLNYKAWKSVDGGATFTEVTTPHGDNHDLWIDPNDPQRMIEGNDGGACISFNSGESWSTIYNQMTSQFYHVTTDDQFPYRVYGTQQDNSAISVPSWSAKGAIPWDDCYTVGGSESGHIAVHPQDPNLVFSGAIGSSPGGGGNFLRYDRATGQIRIITVWPELTTGMGAKAMKYRFQWTYPIQFSPHDPDVLYAAGNQLFRSTDQGGSWEAISPDLTRNDPSKLEPSGGPITKDSSGAEVYCTIFAFVESPHEQGVLWTGSDDGLVHISRDGGDTWDNVTPEDLAEWSLVCMIEQSPHDPATAYVAATRYRLDDTRPMLYRTTDYGQSWTRIVNGIPADDFTRVVREDPSRKGLLYAGTETGVYVSFNDGGAWQPLQANLPKVPIYDLVVKGTDLIASTHGRSFWVLDDLTLLHQVADGSPSSEASLLAPRPAHRMKSASVENGAAGPGKNYGIAFGTPLAFYEAKKPDGPSEFIFLDAGKNAPSGALVNYYLERKPENEIRLEFTEAGGQVIRAFSSQSDDEGLKAPSDAGMNRFVWDMRYPPPRKVPDDKSTEDEVKFGPLAPPGTYQVRLTVDGVSSTESFEILKDPRVSTPQEDLQAQFDLLIRIRDKLSETHDGVNKLRSVREQVNQWVQRAQGGPSSDAVSDAAVPILEKLAAIEDRLIQVDYRGARDRLDLPVRLNNILAELPKVVASADFAPPKQTYEVFSDVSGRIDAQLGVLAKVVDDDVPAFNELVKELDLPAIVPQSPGLISQ